MRILLVDDSVDVLDVLDELLSDDFKVFKTSNPKNVLDLIQSNNIDLLITDLNMPEVSGLELSLEVRKIHFDLPIIIFTARDREIVHNLSIHQIQNLHFVGDKDMNQLLTLVQNVSKRYTLPFGTKE